MTYVSKKEKVFDLPEQEEESSTCVALSEPKLKRFPSVSDRRAWTSEESQRYQHLYGLVSGSESNLSKSSSFKYIPFDVLLAILMAEKDAYIQELLDRQEDSKSCCGVKANVLFKSDGFEDSDDDREALIRKDAEVVSLKNKIAGLESELEDYKETLTKAMHKLETMDTVMCENQLLREKIVCSEETIKCLEQKKAELEKQLEYSRRTYFIDSNMGEKLPIGRQCWDGGDCEEVVRLSSERDILLQQVTELQRELERVKANSAELEVLRKLSQTTYSSLEEVSKENECFRKKLEGMKCLEKHIEELKKQAVTLTDKYKRESQKANDHLKQISVKAMELHVLREERDRLQRRVNELIYYENQYFALEAKLHQVEAVIDENEMLNKKLIQLNTLEIENKELKTRIAELKCAEIQAVEYKEQIVQLEGAVSDQEEEIKKMLRQIEELSNGYTDKNEIHELKKELEEKTGKLKTYEKQLADIPVLESEIEELKNKLHKCIDDFRTDKDLLKRLQEELEACQKRCHELEEMGSLCQFPVDSSTSTDLMTTFVDFGQIFTPTVEEKGDNTEEIETEDTETQSVKPKLEEKAAEACLENIDLMKLREFEEQNQHLRIEVTNLQFKLSQIDMDELLLQTNELKMALGAKAKKITDLEGEVARLYQELKTLEKVKRDLVSAEEKVKIFDDQNNILKDEVKVLDEQNCMLKKQVKVLDDQNNLLKEEINLRHKKLTEIEELLRVERKSRKFALNTVDQTEEKLQMETEKRKLEEVKTKLIKEEANIAKQDIYVHFSMEISDLKAFNNISKKLIKDLHTENEILREMKEYLEKTEKTEQEKLIKRLQAEVRVLKNLSKPRLEEEYEFLKGELRNLLKETDSLLEEIKDLKSALNLEKMEKDKLENEVRNLQAELSACIASGNEVLGKEMAAKESLIEDLRSELQNTKNDSQELREENVKLSNTYNTLKSQQKDREIEITRLLRQVEELNNTVKIQSEREKQYEDNKITAQNEETLLKESNGSMQQRVMHLEELLKIKDGELKEVRETAGETTNELNKLHSEVEVLRNRLAEKDSGCASEVDYERELEEKYALEEALRKIEFELEELKVKLEECKAMEEEMTNLKSKRDSLLEKMSDFENEIDGLKKKLCRFERLKEELDKLRAERKEDCGEGDSAMVRQPLKDRTEIESLKMENENFKEELTKTEDLLDVCRKLQTAMPPNQSPTQEFFTPPPLPSPTSSDLESVPMEKHRKEMMDLENQYKAKVQNLMEMNAEKVRKLMEHHERETKCRGKTFNENINHVRTSYENDIRKLVEKHKRSIMRLQGLHEDQVQELNTNHETQMEAMQTQHENVINDLRTEAAEKCKQLRQDHNREVQELELKYEAIIRQKQVEFLAEKSTAQTTTSQSTDNIKEIHKQTVDNLNQYYQTSIAELEEKHNKELKKCKKSNLKRIELMKNKYEALLVEERKKYEEQLEGMLLQLQKGPQKERPEEHGHHFTQKTLSTPTNPRLDFLEILQKIINEGLDSLTFEELIVVHSKTCFLPESLDEEVRDGEGVPPGIGTECRHRSLMAAEKEELLKRIFNLEHEIVIKQLETHEAIVNMETAERYRLQELKNALCTAQQKNTELKRLLSSQSKLQMDLKIDKYMLDKQASMHETSVMEKVKELEREKAERKRLEEELQRERTTLKHLTSSFESEKERFKCQRKRDAEYVDSIRHRLEEALHHEQMMESRLESEAMMRAKLEAELQATQKSFSYIEDLQVTQLPAESKAVKDIKNHDQCETNKEIQSRHSRSKSKHRSKSRGLRNL